LNGEEVTVEPLPLQLLRVLLQRPDEVVSRAELFQALWQDRPTVDHVLANAISKLRRALGEEAGARLVNVPKVGYRLVGPVERLAVGRRQARAVQLVAGARVPGQDDFNLVRLLGDGIASTTWLAEHRRLPQRWVFKFALDGEQLAALKRELTTVRLLHKELGSRDDLVEMRACNFAQPPFFVAYDDAGVDLSAWAVDGDRLASLAVEGRLALFLKIARALAAAHSVGVLHRDLKPGNVLVAEVSTPSPNGLAWQVRLSDFGSSHLLEPARLAALGVTAMGLTITEGSHPLMGSTPHYLAPELLAGEKASMRSDLFALGLILYQLLVGDLSRPLATGWEHDIADPLLIDDVRAATEGRPDRRLASVAQLVERLESLDARRAQREAAAAAARQLEATAQRLRVIRAQRPWVVALCVCLALGVIGATGFGLRARAAQRQAELANGRSRVINDFLYEDVLQVPGGTDASSSRSVLLDDLIARAQDRAGERFKDDPIVLAQVRRRLGDLYLGMSFGDQAEYEYRRVITVLENEGNPDGPELLAARLGLAQSLTGRGHPMPALAALEAAERTAGTRALAGAGSLACRAMQTRVQVLIDAGRDREAQALAEQLVHASDLPIEDGRIDNRRRIEARQLLGQIDLALGDEAHATALMNELAAPPFNAGSAATAMSVRARLRQVHQHLLEGKPDDAESVLSGLHDALLKEAAPDAVLLGLVESERFELYRRTSRPAEAWQASTSALQYLGPALGERHSLVTNARMNVALAELDLGRPHEALRDFIAARTRINANGNHADELRAIDLGRARALKALGRAAEASELLDELKQAQTDTGTEIVPGAGALALKQTLAQ